VYLVLFDATTCFDCPLQPSSGTVLVYKKGKEGRGLSLQIRKLQTHKFNVAHYSVFQNNNDKGGRWVRLTTYHLRSAEGQENPGPLTYPEPLGPPRPVVGDLFTILYTSTNRPTGETACNSRRRYVAHFSTYQDRQCTFDVTFRRFRWCAKAICITYSESTYPEP
jgi:hypothetical protein